jgi:hypothetical protein
MASETYFWSGQPSNLVTSVARTLQLGADREGAVPPRKVLDSRMTIEPDQLESPLQQPGRCSVPRASPDVEEDSGRARLAAKRLHCKSDVPAVAHWVHVDQVAAGQLSERSQESQAIAALRRCGNVESPALHQFRGRQLAPGGVPGNRDRASSEPVKGR